jgi:hypothetical protein
VTAPYNPPAFPSVCLGDPGHPSSEPGMSLRDYFAGEALPQTILLVLESVPGCSPTDNGGFAAAVAHLSYQMADAMLVERMAARL